MNVSKDEIHRELREFILRTFLLGEKPSALTDETPLLVQGILDSISVLQLVAFLEKRFGVKLHARDMEKPNLNTVASIAKLVQSKL